MIHIIRMEQTGDRFWFARCSCGWISEHFASYATAEQHGIDHANEHNEMNA